VESEPSAGVALLRPAADGPIDRYFEAPRLEHKWWHKKEFLRDDEPSTGEYVATLLRKVDGYRSETVVSGQEASEDSSGDGPGISIIVTC